MSCVQVIAGLMGIPPPNCVIPQAPMHTKSLVTLKQMLVGRNAERKTKLHQAGIDSKTKSTLDLASLQAVPVNTRKSHADLQVSSPHCVCWCLFGLRFVDYVCEWILEAAVAFTIGKR